MNTLDRFCIAACYGAGIAGAMFVAGWILTGVMNWLKRPLR